MNKDRFLAGTVISVKKDPEVRLIINEYAHQMYFCVRVGDRSGSEIAYSFDEIQIARKGLHSNENVAG